jgi:hypothetical protein
MVDRPAVATDQQSVVTLDAVIVLSVCLTPSCPTFGYRHQYEDSFRVVAAGDASLCVSGHRQDRMRVSCETRYVAMLHVRTFYPTYLCSDTEAGPATSGSTMFHFSTPSIAVVLQQRHCTQDQRTFPTQVLRLPSNIAVSTSPHMARAAAPSTPAPSRASPALTTGSWSTQRPRRPPRSRAGSPELLLRVDVSSHAS